MSVDVEDWFQVENLRPVIPRQSWSGRELRVERNVRTILDLLDRTETRATFFVLGWIAEASPGTIREIHRRGHEVACHGYGHEMVSELDPARLREDVTRARGILQDLTGTEVVGYRAPAFSITEWAIDVLRECGFRYDSSHFPSFAHDRYGKIALPPGVRSGVVPIREDFYEIVVSCLEVGGRNLPWAGGGYFRLLPFPLFKAGVRRILERDGLYCFYAHPWEVDPEQPRIRGLRPDYRFRHYVNLHRTASRWERLARKFRFAPLVSALPPRGVAVSAPAVLRPGTHTDIP